ncbi:nucleotide-binding domain containing protein [Bradyrhizobium cajani]|uniref:Four-carbon acid sugar kinase family protein n=1 Tax=Bradyrhizobium cajani TaxID=1928661 RepID=A0A844TKH6_9BRAD|nr:nucleotide-binding domain containing protein [Bradyrhizobium cajani]MCP3371816.1 four-carbon acid sugar kinase family protein [Bradyrhizobium cajani]MVT76364.1 hypothetical protein [Bradyrhizobium cajani]
MTGFSRYRIGVLGDDLTGVNAVVTEAAELGMRCIVTDAKEDGVPERVDVWGIDLASRDSGSKQSQALVRAGIGRMRDWGADHLLLKIDSRGRGDPMALVAAAATEARPVIVSGAAPSNLPHGAVLIEEANPYLAASQIASCYSTGQTLWVGGVGLMTVLLWASITDRMPLGAVVGSYQPNIAPQVEAMRGLGALVLQLNEHRLAARLGSAWSACRPVVIETMPAATSPGATADADAAFRQCAALLAPHLMDRAFGLILTGGHTANVVLRALDVRRLDLVGRSVIDGAPLLRAALPALSKGLIVTKPGHFGGPDALVRIAMHVQLRAAMG